MKFTLLRFQETTVADALTNVRLAMDEVSRVGLNGAGQVVTLVAPTGAGKTVMAAAILESLLEGDESHTADEALTVVWLSDLPRVNEQTAKRVKAASDKIDESRLVHIDTDFSEDELAPGRIYFLNTQKLSITSGLVSDSEDRSYTIWEVLNRTIQREPSKFLLVLDEAHRGMDRSAATDGPNSIVQRFILGNEALTASPTILGLSATPKRFTDLLDGTNRVVRKAEASVADVRASGLIKERVIVWRPEHGLEHSEHTLLQRAAQDMQDYDLRWRLYSQGQGLPRTIAPILVVQVEDKTSDKISATDLEQAIEAIEEILGPQSPDSFAHSFGDAPVQLTVGASRRLRYLNPADVEDDPEVRVVFFKTSLTTGWDCPRAEVMMSYRSAKDPTSIAQLVGRMVRTPLARRVNDDDVLNSVALYLPKYDRAAVQDIVKQLRSGDPESYAAVDADDGDEVVLCDRQTELWDKIKDSVSTLKTYIVPSVRRLPPIRRLERLAGSLSDFELRPDAPNEAEEAMLSVLSNRLKQLQGDDTFNDVIEQSRKIGLSATILSCCDWRNRGPDHPDRVDVSLARATVRAGREPDRRGSARTALAPDTSADTSVSAETANLMVIAVLRGDGTVAAVEARARELFEEWISLYADAVEQLGEAEQEEIDRLREVADAPSTRGVALPGNLHGRSTAKSTNWPNHLYVDENGYFPDALNDPEKDVLETEMKRSGHVCWLRNRDRQRWAIAFPYDKTPTEKAASYPDFVFFREGDGEVKVDLVDTHGVHLPDAPAKARGFAGRKATAVCSIESRW